MPLTVVKKFESPIQCRERTFRNPFAHVGYAALVFFSSAHLSIPSGLALEFLLLPRDYFTSDPFEQVFAHISVRLLGALLAVASAVAFGTVIRIGANICGLCLPVQECMTRRTARTYTASHFLLWVGLLSLGLFFGDAGSITGATVFTLTAISQLIRVSIVLPKAFSKE